SQNALAQITEETYHKAEYFLSDNIQRKVYHLDVNPTWLANKKSFWHQTYTEDGKRFFLTDIEKRETKVAFDHRELATLMSEKSGETIDSKNLPFNRIQLKDACSVVFDWMNKSWTYATGELVSKRASSDSRDRSIS